MARRRRTRVSRSGTPFVDNPHYEVYGYNDRNELLTSDYYTGSYPGTNVPAKDFIYAYDPIGNRTSYTPGTQSPGTTYIRNGLNQYEETSDPTEVFSYDDDGNLTAADASGTTNDWTYEWDGENRLIAAYKTSPSSGSDKKVVFEYDYAGRRVEKKVYAWVPGSPGQWSTTASPHLRFVWGGSRAGAWLMLLELNGASSNAVLRSYTWGLDLAGLNGQVNSLEGVAGIGGLLAIHTAAPVDYLYFCDGNGNVGQLIEPTEQQVAAQYEYDPYGNLTSYTDDVGNPFRFSTKLRDTETGLYYFGYRYYLPRLGRWISRDPIDEMGRPRTPVCAACPRRSLRQCRAGLNLYAYTSGRPVGGVDPIGLAECSQGLCDAWCSANKKGGVTICEGGSKCHCVCTDLVLQTFPDPIAGPRIAFCIGRHEQVHENGSGVCSTTGPRTVVGPDGSSYTYYALEYSQSADYEECKAQTESIDCAGGSFASCAHSPDCRECFEQLIDFVSSRTCTASDPPPSCSATDAQECRQRQKEVLEYLKTMKKCVCGSGGAW
jgi:RHS repeat-associated protein